MISQVRIQFLVERKKIQPGPMNSQKQRTTTNNKQLTQDNNKQKANKARRVTAYVGVNTNNKSIIHNVSKNTLHSHRPIGGLLSINHRHHHGVRHE